MIRALNKYCADIASWDILWWIFIWLKVIHNIPMKNYFQRHYQKEFFLNPGRIYEEESDQYIRLSYGYATPEQMTGIKLLSELIEVNHKKSSLFWRIFYVSYLPQFHFLP